MDSEAPCFREARLAMVRDQIKARGVRDPRVLQAMSTIPRHRFLSSSDYEQAYDDHPISIGPAQTISQPYIVAYMAEALCLRPTDRVLEVGSGCGYASAVIASICQQVIGLELETFLVERAIAVASALQLPNVRFIRADGCEGFPALAPYDAILLSCCSPEIPPALWAQLAEGGRLLIPRGHVEGIQQLCLVSKVNNEQRVLPLLHVSFVPLRSLRS